MWDDVRKFVEDAPKIETAAGLDHAFGKLISGWGFDNFLAVQISSQPNALKQPLARSFGKPLYSWLDHYQEAGHVHRDTSINQILNSSLPFWWSDIESAATSKDERLVFEEARSFRLRRGLVVPVRIADGSVWSCALAAEHCEETESLKLAAFAAASYYVSRGVALHESAARSIDQTYQLTPRQRQVLVLLGQGLSVPEAAEALRRSERTIAHQVEDAKRRLGVGTQAGLIARALLCGEVTLRDLNHEPQCFLG